MVRGFVQKRLRRQDNRGHISPSYVERSWAISLNVSNVDRILWVPPCLSLAMLPINSTGTKSWFFVPILKVQSDQKMMEESCT